MATTPFTQTATDLILNQKADWLLMGSRSPGEMASCVEPVLLTSDASISLAVQAVCKRLIPAVLTSVSRSSPHGAHIPVQHKRSTMRFLQLAALLLLASCALLAQSFRNPSRVLTPTDPLSVIAGDINGDGHPDLLYGSGLYGNAVLHPLLQGGGAFIPAPVIALPPTINANCTLADLNADRKLDLICMGFGVINSSMQVAVLLGNGDGTFGMATIVNLPSGGTDSELYPAAVGDLNHDGHPDVVVTDAVNNRIFALLGDGTGKLTLVSVVASSTAAVQAVLADLDGDGNLDLIAQGIEVYKGHGDGTFGTGITYGGSQFPVLADIDGDGRPDLIGGSHGVLKVFHGNADGSFAPNPVATVDYTDGANVGDETGFGSYIGAYACLDLNGDGIPDILARGDDGLTIIMGLPNLQFAKPVHYPVSQNFLTGVLLGSNQLIDLNGDGHPDLVAIGPGGILITYGQTGGTFGSGSVYEAGYLVSHATVADFNGDGSPDVVTSGDLQLQLSLGRGDGTFEVSTPIPGTVIYTRGDPRAMIDATVVHGDFNGDGHQDVLTTGAPSVYTSRPSLFLGHGDGSFGVPIAVSNAAVSVTTQAAVADINGDGKDDVASSDGTTISVNLSSGDGTFRTVSTALTQISGERSSQTIAFADLNGDGRLDLVYTTTNNLAVMTGRGDGTFSPAIFYPVPATSAGTGRSPGVPAIGDFDGDGRLDIAVLVAAAATYAQLYNPTQIFTFYRQGSPTGLDADGFTPAVAGPVSARSYVDFFAADVDGDGKADAIADDDGNLYNEAFGNAIGVFHGLANRTFSAEQNFVAGTGLASLLIADLDRNGLLDLVVANGDYNEIANSFTVLLNGAPALTVPASQTTTATTANVSPNPSTYGQPVIFTTHVAPATSTGLVPTGTVVFSFCRGATTLVTLDATGSASFITPTGTEIAEPVGSCPFAANYQGDANFLPSTSPSVPYLVLPAPSITSVSAQPDPGHLSQSISLQAIVQGVPSPTANPVTGQPIPPGVLQSTGTVQFLDGSTVLGTATVNNGTATLTTNTLSLGTHTIVATYSGDANLGGSSGSTSEVILPSSFTLGLSPTSLSFETGKGGSTIVTLTSVGAYAGTLTLSYGTLPTGMSASFSPITVQLSAGGSGVSTLSIGTALVAADRSRPDNRTLTFAMLSPAALVGLALLRLPTHRRRRISMTLLSLVAGMFFVGVVGCTTIKAPYSSLAPGTYTIPITATNPLTLDKQSANLTVVVTP